MKKILMIFFTLSMFSFSLNKDPYDYRFDVSVTVKEKDTGIEIVQIVNGSEHLIGETIEFLHGGKGNSLVNGESIPSNFEKVRKNFKVKLTNHSEGYVAMTFTPKKVKFSSPSETNLGAEYFALIGTKDISNGEKVEILGSKGLYFDIESRLEITDNSGVVKAVPGVMNSSEETTLTVTFYKTK